MLDILAKLNINSTNSGAYSGYGWQSTAATKEGVISSYSPATGNKLAEVISCSEADYQLIMTRSLAAFNKWRETPAPKRGDLIRQIGDLLRENKKILGNLVSLEMGKSKEEGEGEVQEMIDMADFAVGQSRMLYGKTMHSERPLHRMYEQWHPYGVIGVITSFNFPVAVWAWNAFIAAICGNVTIWKPSAQTPLCAIAVHLLCSKVLQQNNCPDIFALMIPKSHDLAEKMLHDSRLPLVSFTGSTAVGKKIAVIVASRLGKCILELGGNNAIIVDQSANLNLAIPGIVFGAIGTAGQRCTSTRRLFVEKSLYKSVLERLHSAYQQVKIGDPLDPKNTMGPLINKDAVLNFQKAIKRIKDLGGEIFFGGEILAGEGNYVQPTIITGLDNSAAIVQEETFAPILYVMTFENISDAIKLQNDVPQGLSGGMFTQNLINAELFLSPKGADCGIANINIGTSGAEIGGAFGGEKETGGGREAGSDSWKAYMRRQTNTINWGETLPLAQGITFSK